MNQMNDASYKIAVDTLFGAWSTVSIRRNYADRYAYENTVSLQVDKTLRLGPLSLWLCGTSIDKSGNFIIHGQRLKYVELEELSLLPTSS
jgi:hypothetical protein